MQESSSELINISELRSGMFIELDVGWMVHPFPTNSFKLSSERQIDILRGLGLKQIRYVPAKSDLQSDTANRPAGTGHSAVAPRRRLPQSELIEVQRRSLIACERRFGEAARQYKEILGQVEVQPELAKAQCVGLVSDYVGDMAHLGETVIRLLSQGSSERASLHSVNVTVLSLLLGRAMGLTQTEMIDLGVGAFLHDIGKQHIPERVRTYNPSFSAPEFKLYQEHVGESVALGRRMGLSEAALQIIGNHHEMVDGSGFPARALGNTLNRPTKILSLVNRYENLCNPSRPASSLTPHEALALIFAQLKTRFDSVVMSAFIRMMGVYPPGSIVQLIDDRFAMVMTVNSSRPLKPRILVHDAKVPQHEALIVDLETTPELGIRRSLKPTELPGESIDYLMPRQRVCYFFEREALPEESALG
jgi:putative nucleotidyltransferase with HDIG domain